MNPAPLERQWRGLTRRQFLKATASGIGVAVTNGAALSVSGADGKADPAFQSFDREIEQFMSPRKVPGGAVAVVKDRRLVYARGYGWADREKKEPVRADSLFRIASISKPFTAVAILKLVEAGKLEMETRVFDLLSLPPVLSGGRQPDSRLKAITVRHLLHHTAGWDRDQSGDPMFMPQKIARAAGTNAPAKPEAIIRYMLGQPLDTDPGAHFAYSNFGFCILGRIIEKVTGRKYDEYVRQEVLAPIGIKRMRTGASLESGRVPGEVKYYTSNDAHDRAVFPEVMEKVPEPYGGFYLEAMDSHGGWVASAVDLARFAAALDDPKRTCGLKPETCRVLYEPPAPPVSRKADGSLEAAYYGCGWDVRPIRNRGKSNYWHFGSLPGTATLLVRRWDGLSWAVLFNQRSEDKNLPDGAIDPAMHHAADAVIAWPEHDLFPEFG